jgi:hypothetical protein
MGVFCLCSLIVACKFGALGFILMYFHLCSFCIMLLHWFNVCFMVFWYCWVGSLFIISNWLSCMKFFILFLYSCIKKTGMKDLISHAHITRVTQPVTLSRSWMEHTALREGEYYRLGRFLGAKACVVLTYLLDSRMLIEPWYRGVSDDWKMYKIQSGALLSLLWILDTAQICPVCFVSNEPAKIYYTGVSVEYIDHTDRNRQIPYASQLEAT